MRPREGALRAWEGRGEGMVGGDRDISHSRKVGRPELADPSTEGRHKINDGRNLSRSIEISRPETATT